MSAAYEPVLLRRRGLERSGDIDVYERTGGYQALRKALIEMTPQSVTDLVIASNLRGRGGAGFPTGRKWSFIPKDAPVKYLAVNADESEPGTFNNRVFIDADPHALVEGILICCFAVGISAAYIYIRGENLAGARALERAIAQARAKGYVGRGILGSSFSCEIHVFRGAGAYICGEETALLESIEGRRPQPRSRPPFPAVVGLFGKPTVINNVETLGCVPSIVERGAAWFKSIGPENAPGPKMYCLSGHVARPGVYERPMGTPLRELIEEHAGGIRGGRSLGFVIPGAAASTALRPDEIDVAMDFDSLRKIGTELGAGGIMVFDDRVCIVETLERLARFFRHESCGKCVPCREGTVWQHATLVRLAERRGGAADVALLKSVSEQISGKTLCALGDFAAAPQLGALRKFPEHFQAHVEGRCPARAEAVVA
ncbi:MAG TPA: NADH-quinone oxidoreductase subunit NuoF [Candidatus Limnocylindria bacterium]|nr:NADH-quinone oxidoreductase subunit NuoF [Candidatus Limnocylindria bacterium]